MSIEITFYVVTDAQLSYLKRDQSNLYNFLSGSPPIARRSFVDRLLGRQAVLISPPVDWPSSSFGECAEINHRAVPKWHYILNGTHDAVVGVPNIFQTWISGDKGCAMRLSGLGKDDVFAHTREQCLQMLALLNALSEDVIATRLRQFDLAASQEDVVRATADALFSLKILREIYGKAKQISGGVLWGGG
jgi:hypothetical protein